jgi:hypothetical protein
MVHIGAFRDQYAPCMQHGPENISPLDEFNRVDIPISAGP